MRGAPFYGAPFQYRFETVGTIRSPSQQTSRLAGTIFESAGSNILTAPSLSLDKRQSKSNAPSAPFSPTSTTHRPSPAQTCGARKILYPAVPRPPSAPSLVTRRRDAKAFRMRVVLSLLKPLRRPISARAIRMLRLISSISLRSSRVIPSGRAASKGKVTAMELSRISKPGLTASPSYASLMRSVPIPNCPM